MEMLWVKRETILTFSLFFFEEFHNQSPEWTSFGPNSGSGKRTGILIVRIWFPFPVLINPFQL